MALSVMGQVRILDTAVAAWQADYNNVGALGTSDPGGYRPDPGESVWGGCPRVRSGREHAAAISHVLVGTQFGRLALLAKAVPR